MSVISVNSIEQTTLEPVVHLSLVFNVYYVQSALSVREIPHCQ